MFTTGAGTGPRIRNASLKFAHGSSEAYRALHPAGICVTSPIVSICLPAGSSICICAGSLTSSPPSALTTTIPNPASAMTTMNKIASDAMIAAGRPSSTRAISASDLPSRRTDAAKTSKSCTAPAQQTPMSNQMRPGM